MKHPLGAWLVLLLGCGSASAWQEAPMLRERVEKGELPPVEQRLPEDPVVVTPIERIGEYGGTWRRLSMAVSDIGMDSRLGYEPLLRWNLAGDGVVPGLAHAWERSDDARRYTFHLRRGLRWSDGHPFTSEDFRFAVESVAGNAMLNPVSPKWLTTTSGLPRVQTPDPYTVVFEFTEPYGLFPQLLAFRGTQGPLFLPKHYLSQFHADYANPDELAALVAQNRCAFWYELFERKNDLRRNPELPSVGPFVIEVPYPSQRAIATRNPYYWKVDPEGRQLPYIDRISFLNVTDQTILNFKAIDGETDFQDRRINSYYLPLFVRNAKAKGYRVQVGVTTEPLCVFVNQSSRDERMRPLLMDRRFRVALSVALNREEIIRFIYHGHAEPSTAVASPQDPYFRPEYDQTYIDYDPDLANALLDELGMKRGADGLRRMPDGSRFHEILHVFPSEMSAGQELWELVADFWREVGLAFTVRLDDATLSTLQVQSGKANFWSYGLTGMHWSLDGQMHTPNSPRSFFAPLYGRYVATHGASGVEPPEEYQRLVDWHREMTSTPDEHLRRELADKILGQWNEQCYAIGICRPSVVYVINNRFRNVPDELISSFRLMSPGYVGIEQFFFESQEGD